MGAVAPGLIEGQQEGWSLDKLIDYGHMPEDDNLYHAPREGFERSRYGHGRSFSMTTVAQMHPALSMGAIIVAAGAVALAIGRSGKRF